MRCPRCPAVWVARPEEDGMIDRPVPPPVTRRGLLIIEGQVIPGGGPTPAPCASAAVEKRIEIRRYGIAAGAAVLIVALVAVVLLAPDVSALPGVALLEGSR
jgi:hypothetical protein